MSFNQWLGEDWWTRPDDEDLDLSAPKKMTAAELNALMGADVDEDEDQ